VSSTFSLTVARVLLATAVLTTIVGAAAVWQYVDRLDDARGRQVAVARTLADVAAMADARLDAAVGRHGLDGGYPVEPERSSEALDHLEELSGVRPADRGDFEDALDTLLSDSAATGSVDERDTASVQFAFDGLARDHREAATQNVRDARRGVHVAVLATAVIGVATLGGALVLVRRSGRAAR
jgi:hypothetical protein